MKKLLVLLALSAPLSVAHADTKKSPHKAPKKSAKKVEVNTCPIAGGSSKGSKISRNYKNYKVNFCCPGCDGAWDKLSAKEKDAKIKAALKKA